MKKIFSVLMILTFLGFSEGVFGQDLEGAKPMMIGTVTKSDFEKEPYNIWFEDEYNSYVVDKKALSGVNFDKGEKILIYFGSWCSDSRREVPRFIKIMDELNFSLDNIIFIALDREKKAPEYQINTWDIQYVPTFIFLNNKNETGRIIETPEESLEKDIFKILNK